MDLFYFNIIHRHNLESEAFYDQVLIHKYVEIKYPRYMLFKCLLRFRNDMLLCNMFGHSLFICLSNFLSFASLDLIVLVDLSKIMSNSNEGFQRNSPRKFM